MTINDQREQTCEDYASHISDLFNQAEMSEAAVFDVYGGIYGEGKFWRSYQPARIKDLILSPSNNTHMHNE